MPYFLTLGNRCSSHLDCLDLYNEMSRLSVSSRSSCLLFDHYLWRAYSIVTPCTRVTLHIFDDSLPIRICGCGQFCTDILVHRRFKRILSCLFIIGIYVLARVCATIITCRIVNVCYEVNYMHIKYTIITILYIVPLRGECVLSL